MNNECTCQIEYEGERYAFEVPKEAIKFCPLHQGGMMKLSNPIDLVLEDICNDLPTATVAAQISLGERQRHLKNLNKRIQASQIGMDLSRALNHVQHLEDTYCAIVFHERQYGCQAWSNLP